MARLGSLQYKKNFSSVYNQLEQMQRLLGGPALAEFMSKEIFPYLRERALARFAGNGDEVTGRWPALKPVTQTIREYYGYGGSGPINQRTGKLMEYVEQATPRMVIGADSVILQYPGDLPTSRALDAKYRTAQRGRGFTGSVSSKPRTPPRPVIAFSATDYIVIQERLETFISTRGIS